MDEEWSTEDLAVGRLMVKAALSVLGDQVDWAEVNQSAVARRVVRAMMAADHIRVAELDRLSAAKGSHVYIEITATEALATAYWIWADNIEADVDLDEVHPACAAGNRFMAFTQGMLAAYQVSDAISVLEDSESFKYIGDTSNRLASVLGGSDLADPNRALADEMWARIDGKKPKA